MLLTPPGTVGPVGAITEPSTPNTSGSEPEKSVPRSRAATSVGVLDATSDGVCEERSERDALEFGNNELRWYPVAVPRFDPGTAMGSIPTAVVAFDRVSTIVVGDPWGDGVLASS